jgi:uncharacterized protein with HEPN domain
MTPREREAIGDIIASADAILTYINGKRRILAKNAMLRDAIIRRFEIMGEATTRLTRETRDAHREIPWKLIVGFRNVLIHAYDQVVPEEVLKAIDSLPPLLAKLRKIR